MKQLVPLLSLALATPSAMASDTNDIWSYQDSNGTTLAQACNNKRTCELIYKNSHYLALVNNRSQTVHIPADHEHRFRFNVNTISGPM
ncbi:hypothetical protein [Aeromonas hydrophila]|uniref:hypothetical protein n=1 Tax=Aeromonas hydrophila TaxID=644 RepID=UPI003D245B97